MVIPAKKKITIKTKIKNAFKNLTPNKEKSKDIISRISKLEIINSNNKILLVFINKKAGGLWGSILVPKVYFIYN